jgi:hypothetical protein
VQNVTDTAAVTFQLLNQTATNIQLHNVHLMPNSGRGTPNVVCDPKSFIDGTANLGFRCVNGRYAPN